MITIEDYFWQSQLSEAAYANLSTDMFGEDDSEYIIALKNEGMSTEQARAFANKYTVVDQYTDPDSGFSGTVFQDTSGKVFIAMRGTQPSAVFTDWPTNIADIGSDGIAIDQGIAMYNWYQRLITPVGEEATQYIYHKEISFSGVIIQSAWLEETTVTVTSQGENEGGGLVGKSDIAVTGHSLGGHLAMIMSRIAPNLVTSTLTFNAPRFDTNLALDWSNIPFSHLTLSTTALTSEGFFDLLEDAEYQNLGSSQIGYEWATSEIINTRVEGDVVSLIGDLPGAGNQQQLFSESINEGPIDAHDMKAITDAFAVCQLLSQIDSNLTLNSITSILKASSNIGKFSLESVVSSLGGLFLSGFNKRTGSEYNSDRDQLYKDIKDITATLSNYPNQSIESFCTIDSEGNSIPFTASDINTLAQSNIAYRYALINLNPFAVIGMDYSEFNQDGELDVNTSSNPNGQLSDQYLQDRANFLVQLLHENIYDTGAKNPYAPINIDVYPNLADYYYADLTTGNQSLNAMYSDLATKKDQHQQFIFGSSSNDTIKGGSKDDHLYGMHGQDTLDGGSGNDTFFVMGEDEDYDIFIGGDDEDTIKGSAGNDTIRLHEFFGEKTVEFINGGGGEDIIAGTDLNDTIDLSDTTLIGIKHIEGGDKVDTITGSAGDDTIYGGAGGDILNGGLGDDTIYGEDDKDTLSGGGGVNHLHGGSGLDIYIVGAAAAEIGETDYISDEDNDGIIRLGDGTVLGGVWEQIAEGRYRHEGTGLEGTIGGGRFTIELSSNKTAIIENWEDGRFGITLREPEAEPEVPEPGSYTAVGDYEWKVFYDNDGDPYYDRDEWGNYILDYEAPAPDKEDTLYDTPDNDELYGYGGVDWLYAYRGGNDIVDGGAGDDWIEKGGGWGILIGGEGSDAVFGDTGNDILYADIRMTVEEIHEAYADGTGTGARGDLLSGQEGDDTLYGWHGDDILAGGIGNDTIYGGAGNDTIEGDAHMGWWYALDPWEVTWEIEPGDVTIYRRTYGGGITWSWGDSADHGNDIIDAGAGDDWIFAGGGNDIVDAGTGNDVVFGEEGNDTIIGGAGEDTINGDSGGDSIPGNMHGVDWIFGGDDNDKINGNKNDDYLFGEQGGDRLYGDSGDLNSFDGADYLDGGAGNDLLMGQGNDDILWGGSGDDYLYGDESTGEHGTYHGNDILHGEAGDDYLNGAGGNDDLYGGSGEDTLYGDSRLERLAGSFHGQDFLDGGADNDLLMGGGNNDILVGGAGDDFLYGDQYGDEIDGTIHGEDTLFGGTGRDQLLGGGGNDFLFGEDGDDNLFGDDLESVLSGEYHGDDVISGGEGNDSISGAGGNDTLFGGSGDDSIFGEVNTVHYTLSEQYHGDDIISGGIGNDHIWGGGGNDTIFGDEDNDQVVGGDGDDTIQGGEGNDLLFGDQGDGSGSGNDTLDGGSGNDQISGEGGADYLYGGLGDDQVIGGEGADFLYGGDGNDMMWGENDDDWLNGEAGNDYLYGGMGDDIIIGGAGNDRLYSGGGSDIMQGGADDDTYILSSGSGSCRIIDTQGYNWAVLSFGFGMGMVLSLVEGSLRVSGSTGGSLFLSGIGLNSLTTTSPIQSMEFSDGVTMTTDEVIEAVGIDIPATESDDAISGTSGRDNINALDGDDTVEGHGGGDIIDLGAGNDTAYGGDGDDTIAGGAGVDLIFGDEGNDYITGGEGADNLDGGIGDDYLKGEDGNDILTGGAGADQMYGGAHDDTLSGGEGADILHGEDGDDHLHGDTGSDSLYGGAGADLIYGGSEADYLSGDAGDDYLQGDGGDDQLHGGIGNDTLVGGAGNDLLNGGAGSDLMTGGTGDDHYLVDTQDDVIVELPDEGIDLVTAQLDYVLGNNLENLTLASGTTVLSGSGNELDNVITGNNNSNSLYGLAGSDTLIGNGGDDVLDGGSGADLLQGGAGNDLYLVDNVADTIVETSGNGTLDRVVATVDYTLSDHLEKLTLSGPALSGTGNTGNNELVGNEHDNILDGRAGNDTLRGGAGDDQLIGGAGNDTLIGGVGNDIYDVDSAGDTVVEQAGEGIDVVNSSITFTLTDHVENLVLTGSANTTGIGNGLDNVITGNAGNNSLQGADGNDQLFGGAGNDNLSGGAGSDLLYGGLGDDTYSISDLEDTIVEYEGEGFDTIDSQVSYTLGDHVERLRLLGTAATAIGNELDNELIGNSADNLLDGGTGADTMLGGAGNDTYITESAGDQIIEGTGAGIDTEQRGYETTSQLAGGVENLMLGTSVINGSGNELDNTITGNEQDNILHGWAGQDILIGGAGNDQLEGGAGHDELIGGSGADSMWGGTGDDIYIVDDAGDQVIEFADEGFDTIRSSLDIVLPDNVEMAFLTGDGDTNITANDLDNSLSGNSGNNIIDGGAGADYMAGMDGDDVYITDNEYDLIAEEEDQGTDTEMRGYETSYSLRDNVENLTLTGTVYRGNGNELDNVITGNDAENNLWGREGSDTLYGNGGDDSLFGDLGDDHLEGNGGDDYLDGGEGDDILLGGEGNDQLDGGAGFNELRGGSGDDVYVYRADAGDYVIDNSDGGQDWLIFTDDITADRLTFVRSGDDLVVQVNRGESTNSVTVTNWFAGEKYQLYGIQPAGASGLLAATINQMFPPDNPEPDGIVVPDESEFDAALHGTLGNDQYPDHVGGTSGNDILRGYQGNDHLFSFAGDDWLLGGSGNDTLNGGTGNDMLYGGAGNDVYIFEAGSGADVIDASGGGMDLLYFDEGLTLDSLVFSRSGDNLVITVDGTDDSVTVLGWFVDADHQLEFIQPFGGSMLSAAQISDLVADDPPPVGDFDTVVEGTASSEQLVGTSGADQLNAYEGDDQLFGLAGNDELNGGDGADYLDGGEGHDVLNGGAGNDQLSGGAGDDVLAGGAGDDTYVYGNGSGADLIDNSGGGADWLLFTDGITSERLSFIQSGDDLVIRVDGDESSQVTVTGWFLGAQYQLAYVQPDGEYGISAATINELFTGSGDEPNPDDFDFVRTGTAAAEQLVGTNGMDLIDGLGGDDQLFGLGGNDWLKGGDGADYLGGGASNDSLFGEAGDDVIFAENGDDYLEGGIGGDYLDGGAGNDMIVGGDGNDQLRGQGGNDTLIGGDGNDNYVYQTGGGADLIINNGGGLDILFFQDGITLERLSFHQSGDDMVVRVDNDDATSVTIQDWYLDADNQVEFLQPDGGYLISAAQITALAQPDLMMAGPTGLMALSAGMMNGDDYTNFRTSAGTSLFGTDSAAQSVSHGLEDLTTKKDSVVGDLMIAA